MLSDTLHVNYTECFIKKGPGSHTLLHLLTAAEDFTVVDYLGLEAGPDCTRYRMLHVTTQII